MGAISFGKPVTKGSGEYPSIAINRQSIVVSVHVESGSYFYRVGKVNKKNKTLTLGDSIPLGRNGERATIALNNTNLAVCVYEDERNSIFSIAGFVDPNAGTIGFGDDKRYDSGALPSVALRDDGGALEVHQSEGGNGIYCHAGPYTNGNINWGGSKGGDDGQAPKAALFGDVACEVHRSETSPSNLYYNVGTVNIQNRSCSLKGGTQYYDTKSNAGSPSPSVALTSSLIAIEVHDVGGGDTRLSYFFGTVDPNKKRIAWPDNPTDMGVFGRTPSVAANDDDVVVVAYTRNGALTYLVGTF